jgi:hypothetical protein
MSWLDRCLVLIPTTPRDVKAWLHVVGVLGVIAAMRLADGALTVASLLVYLAGWILPALVALKQRRAARSRVIAVADHRLEQAQMDTFVLVMQQETAPVDFEETGFVEDTPPPRHHPLH